MTLKNFLSVIFPFLFFHTIIAQGFESSLHPRMIKLVDMDGKSFRNPPTDIEGSPFFNERWMSATVKLTDSSVYKNVAVRVNLQTQELHFLTPEKLERSISSGKVAEIVFDDSLAPGSRQEVFRSGYAPVDNQTELNFYQVLADGRLTLLKSTRKILKTRKDELSGESKKLIVTYEDYYTCHNQVLTLFHLNRNSVMGLMQDQEAKVGEFVKTNKLSWKSAGDLVTIAAYYNSL